MCCHNNYTVKNSESDLDLFKKDVGKSKGGRKKKITVYEEDEETIKNKRNKEFLDKHMKDSSFKLNSSTSRMEIHERMTKLNEIINNNLSPLLNMKVLNSSSHIVKGTVISMNCQGLLINDNNTPEDNINNSNLLRKGKDGIIYFGYYPEHLEKEMMNIDYNIPIAKSNMEKNEQANM